MSEPDKTWAHGCDACDADAPVEYVAPLGYLCALCRRPESLEDLRREWRVMTMLLRAK